MEIEVLDLNHENQEIIGANLEVIEKVIEIKVGLNHENLQEIIGVNLEVIEKVVEIKVGLNHENLQ